MASGLSTGVNASLLGMGGSKVVASRLRETAAPKSHHVVAVQDVTKSWLLQLMELAERLRQMPREEARQILQGKVVATLFYEPSTRTRMSFESAVMRLGGSVVGAENALENSSAKKGETLADVFRVVGSYVDAIVIRHHERDTVREAVKYSPVPIVSAGTGAGEHPTQAMLDVYTIWRELGCIDGVKLTVAGDLRYGRTVHSLLRLLTWFDGIEVTLFAPEYLTLPQDLVEELTGKGLVLHTGTNFHATLAASDIVYQTRIQTERFTATENTTEASYVIGAEELACLPPQARILHPLPRVNEISPEVDEDPRAAYFRQVENGLYMRMALLAHLLGGRQ